MIEENKLRALLFGFIAKVPILKRTKRSKRPDFADDEVITINKGFKSRGRKMNLMPLG